MRTTDWAMDTSSFASVASVREVSEKSRVSNSSGVCLLTSEREGKYRKTAEKPEELLVLGSEH